MGSYKAYLEQGLDLCPKIYLPDDREPQTQHVDYPELPDDVRQGTQFAYERKATLNTPTHASQGQDIGPTRDFIAPLRIPTRPTQDTDSAHDFIAPSSIPTRPSQDTPSNNRTPSNSRSNPRSNSLSSHQSHLSRPDPLHSQSLNSKDSNPFPPPAPPQPRSPCYKPLWSKVTRAPPPPSPRTTGLWTNGLRSSTATPPLAPDAVELEASRPDGLFARRRKSFVPLLDLSPAEFHPREKEEERRQSSPSPMPVSARAETWPSSTSRQMSHNTLPPHHSDPDFQTNTTPYPQRPSRSYSQNDQIPIHAPPFPSTPYSITYPTYPSHNDNPSTLPLQHHLNYTFKQMSLLSEALTPPAPGHSNNAKLSYLGRRAMELVLWESCYALRLSERAAREAVARALGMEALVGAGMRCGLGVFVGGGQGDLATR